VATVWQPLGRMGTPSCRHKIGAKSLASFLGKTEPKKLEARAVYLLWFFKDFCYMKTLFWLFPKIQVYL